MPRGSTGRERTHSSFILIELQFYFFYNSCGSVSLRFAQPSRLTYLRNGSFLLEHESSYLEAVLAVNKL